MPRSNAELADFLRRARSQQDPQRAGLPADTRVRRVPGLRREEVALLAGVSTDYYARLEQGRRIVPSPAVIDALVRALDLGPAGKDHLTHLLGVNSSGDSRSRRQAVQRVRPGVVQLLAASMAYRRSRSGDAATSWPPTSSRGRCSPTSSACRRPNGTTHAGSSPTPARGPCSSTGSSRRGQPWKACRLDMGADPNDRLTRQLVDELRAQDPEFARWWDEHRVYQRTYGAKRLRHPVVGDLTVDYETLSLPGDNDTTLYLYSTEPHSPSQRALSLLTSWTLTAPQPANDHP